MQSTTVTSAARALDSLKASGPVPISSSWKADCESHGCSLSYVDTVVVTGGQDSWYAGLDPATGETRRTAHSEGFHAGEPVSPRPDGGFYSSRISALEAFDSRGNSLWVNPLSDSLDGATASGPEGNCYISDDDTFYAVAPHGKVAWSKNIRRGWHDHPAVVGPDGTVEVADRHGVIYAFTPDGHEKWRYEGLKDSEASFPVVKTRIVIGDDGRTFFGGPDGRVHCLDPDGNLLWSREVAGPGTLQEYDTPAVDAAGILYASGRDSVLAFDPQGTLLWKQQVGSILNLTAAPKGGVIAGIRGGPLQGLDREGIPRWTFAEGNTFTAPVFGPEGEFYTTRSGRYVFRVDAKMVDREEERRRALEQAAAGDRPAGEIRQEDDYILVGDVSVGIRG